MSDIHDLVAAYAVDAVDNDERLAFEAHLDTCSQCRAELAELSFAVDHLAGADAVVPPAHLKDSVMSAIDDQPTSLDHHRRNRAATWVAGLVAVAAVIVVGVFVGTSGSSDSDRIAEVLAAQDAMTVTLEGDAGPSEFVYSVSVGAGVFYGSEMAAPPSGDVYQLWLIDDSTPLPESTFEPDDADGILIEGVQSGLIVAITIEPPGGSQLPTSDPVGAAELQ